MKYVKKSDGTLISSECDTVKVTENTLKKYLDAVKSLNYFIKNSFHGPYTNVLSYNDTENVINMDYAFSQSISNSISINGIPNLNTNKVTSMVAMFNGSVIYDDEKIPLFNTSNVTNMSNMFAYFAVFSKDYNNKKAIRIPTFDTSNVTNMKGIFSHTIIGEEQDNTYNVRLLFPKPFFNTNNVTNFSYMFEGNYRGGYSAYTASFPRTIPYFNTSNATNIYGMFNQAKGISIIPAYDFSNVTSAGSLFTGCNTLTEIHFTGLKVSFDISSSTLFERAALIEILNNLGTPTTTQTLTIGSTNLAKLTEEDIAIATQKNWTLK